MNRTFKIIGIVLNYLIFALEVFFFCTYTFGVFTGGENAPGMDTFRFFTNDSNLLLGLACAVLGTSQIIALHGKKNVPLWTLILKLCGTVGTALTFLTVYCYLAPTMGWDIAIAPSYFLWVHTALPLFGALSFIFFDREPVMKGKDCFYGLIPTVLYALFIIPLVSTGTIKDPYGFTNFAAQAWWISLLVVIGMAGGTLLVSFLLVLAHNKVLKAAAKESAEKKAEAPKEEKKEETKPVAQDDIPVTEDTGDEEAEEAEEEKEEAEATAKGYQNGPRVYHISQHDGGKWQVKLATGQKAIKLFDTQAEAIDYAKGLVKTQGGSIRVHSMKGSIRKD
jgi:Na+-transporting methylmalonyl-CoA/oxaloacetate decarboxylase gamma subunit